MANSDHDGHDNGRCRKFNLYQMGNRGQPFDALPFPSASTGAANWLGDAAIFAHFPEMIGHQNDHDGRQNGDMDGVEITQRALSDFWPGEQEIGNGRAHQRHIAPTNSSPP